MHPDGGGARAQGTCGAIWRSPLAVILGGQHYLSNHGGRRNFVLPTWHDEGKPSVRVSKRVEGRTAARPTPDDRVQARIRHRRVAASVAGGGAWKFCGRLRLAPCALGWQGLQDADHVHHVRGVRTTTRDQTRRGMAIKDTYVLPPGARANNTCVAPDLIAGVHRWNSSPELTTTNQGVGMRLAIKISKGLTGR